jgi:uncharacterized membrane protein YhaH (DUF805 family)
MHDIGLNGWMLLLFLIPFIGPLLFMLLATIDSEPRENKYGAPPKEIKDNDQEWDNSLKEIIIQFVILWMLFFHLFIKLFPSLLHNNWLSQYLNVLFTLIWGIIPLMLVYTLKNKPLKMILYFLAGLHLIYRLYEAKSFLF